jgi:signal transduction histidine kinase
VQFLIDGKGIAEQFAALDRNLVAQAALAFGVGSSIIGIGLGWAFRRLQRTNRLLLDRTNRLLRTNEELALAAKTSAVGAITAHLVHGLSGPLAGLEELVTSRGRDELAEDEWQDAATTTRHLKETIADILRMLGEEHAIDRYEISVTELTRLARDRVVAAAQMAGVELEASVEADGSLPNREANLTLLILENLLRNAIQATARGRWVRLVTVRTGDAVAFEVRDEGTGVPAHLLEKLFTPLRSPKSGGHGIGLAIGRQLANHLGAVLELKTSSATGSVFELRLPRSRFAGQGLLGSRGHGG